MKRSLVLLTASVAILAAPVAFGVLVNPGFAPESAFTESSPPEGWLLRDQESRALISRSEFAFSGEHVFRFEELQRGFGANKLEQCVSLTEDEDFDFGIWLRTPTPSEELALRLNVEFYAGEADCLSRENRNADIGNDDFDFDLDIPANIWTRFGSDSYSADALEDAGPISHARISYRVRDRSGEEGEPAFPLTQVYLDGAWVNGGDSPDNAAFDEVSYADDLSFDEGSGPIGWILRDVSDGAFLSRVDFARSNSTVFWFDQLERGFGDNKLDQCVLLPSGTSEVTVSAWVMTMDPNDDLRVRFASEFYATQADCLERENQIGERFDTDIRINESVADEGEWGQIESDPVVFADDLPEAPAYVRISIRARDRSDGGEPSGLLVFFDDISTNLVNPNTTGAWYDPAKSGQGFNLQQTPVGLMGFYYGYDNGDQMWLQLGMVNEPLVFGEPFDAPVFSGNGGVFGSPEDPANPPLWGRMVARFDSCTDGQITLSGESGTQVFDVTLLAQPEGAELVNCREFGPSERPVATTAAWYDPDSDGQGWNFLYTPVGLLGFFYGYDSVGAPLWLMSDIIDVDIGETAELELFSGTGGTFEQQVPPEELTLWGTAEIEFIDCQTAVVDISGNDGSQTQNLTVLIDTAGIPDCQ